MCFINTINIINFTELRIEQKIKVKYYITIDNLTIFLIFKHIILNANFTYIII